MQHEEPIVNTLRNRRHGCKQRIPSKKDGTETKGIRPDCPQKKLKKRLMLKRGNITMQWWSTVQFINNWHQHHISPTQASKMFGKENLSENPGRFPVPAPMFLGEGRRPRKQQSLSKPPEKVL